MNAGDEAAALDFLDKVSIVADERKEAERLIARLKLHSGAAQDLDALRAKVAAEPNNLEAKFALAQAFAGVEKYREGLAGLLEIVKTDRSFQDDAARKAMVQIFDVLGSEDPLTEQYRSELAKVLFR
jgi:putative thioredoxin